MSLDGARRRRQNRTYVRDSACWEPNWEPINFRQATRTGSTRADLGSPPDDSYRRHGSCSADTTGLAADWPRPNLPQAIIPSGESRGRTSSRPRRRTGPRVGSSGGKRGRIRTGTGSLRPSFSTVSVSTLTKRSPRLTLGSLGGTPAALAGRLKRTPGRHGCGSWPVLLRHRSDKIVVSPQGASDNPCQGHVVAIAGTARHTAFGKASAGQRR